MEILNVLTLSNKRDDRMWPKKNLNSNSTLKYSLRSNFNSLITLCLVFVFSLNTAHSAPETLNPERLILANPVTIKVEVFDSPEEFLKSDQADHVADAAASSTDTSENVVSFVNNASSAVEVKKTWGSVLRTKFKSKFRYLEYPVLEVKKHFSDQINYYRESQLSMLVLTALIGSTTFNLVFFGHGLDFKTQSFLVVTNAILYAYLITNVKNWQAVLKGSEHVVEKIRGSKDETKHVSASSQIVGNLAANFVFFLTYNLTTQGIIHWSDLSQMLGGDLIGYMLTNTILGVASTGVWDTTFRKWFLEGRIATEKRLIALNLYEALGAAVMHSMISMGNNFGYMGLVASASVGATALVVTSNGFVKTTQKLKEKINWAYSRGRISITKAVNTFTGPTSTSNLCPMYLR